MDRLSIHSPRIIAEARREGISALQAYRRAQARETINRTPRLQSTNLTK